MKEIQGEVVEAKQVDEDSDLVDPTTTISLGGEETDIQWNL